MFCVYKLENNRGEVYYGKTNNPKRRWRRHRCIFKGCSSGILWEDGGVVNDIEVLQWFDTEELALEREKELIQNNNCVNLRGKYTQSELKERIRAYEKRYQRNNKEKRNAYSKEYYENNKEKINSQKLEKIKCDVCSSMISRSNISNHKRTAKCKNSLKNSLMNSSPNEFDSITDGS